MGVGYAEWVSPWWQAVNLPPVWDVCGIRASSLTLWHMFALERLGNPYLLGGECKRSDAVALLLFASRDMRGGLRLVRSPHHRSRRQLLISLRLFRRAFNEIHVACLDYIDTCLRTVGRYEKQEGGGKKAAVPYQWHIAHRLCRDWGMKLDEAWNTPYALARHLYDVSAESEGDDSLLSEQAQRVDDNMTAENQEAG